MAKIIISYRRSDSDAIAGRIRDRLASHFGEASLFMDIDNIPFGIDFREHIKREFLSGDAVVAVIGSKWLGPAEGGHYRIKDESDPVRIEVETALEKGIPIIPVLVNEARMPSPAELPESLKDFAFRNAAQVDTGRDFHAHMERLIRALERAVPALLNPKSAPKGIGSTGAHVFARGRRRTLVLFIGGIIGASAAAVITWALLFGTPPAPPSSTAAQKTPEAPIRGACGEMPLDENIIPAAGPPLRDAVKNAITPFFQCNSRSVEQHARAFATLSVVIAHYAPRASCFNGDGGAASFDWSAHKGWADRQGDPFAMLGNLRSKIDSAVNCMDVSQQPQFYVDMARALKAVATSPESGGKG